MIKTEFAPKSKSIFLFNCIATTLLATITIKTGWHQAALLAIGIDFFGWLSIKLFNPDWCHRYHIQLGSEAARVNHRKMLREYEIDYVKRDKYISQRLLAAQHLKQVPDRIGANIYMVGRYREKENFRPIITELEELQEKYDDIQDKYDTATGTLDQANGTITDLKNEKTELQRKYNDLLEELKAVTNERDRLIREFEREFVGFSATDQEEKEAARQEAIELATRRFNKMPELLREMTGTTLESEIQETIEEMEKARNVPDKEPDKEKPETGGQLAESQRKELIAKIKTGQYKQNELAALYGVSQSYISRLKKQNC